MSDTLPAPYPELYTLDLTAKEFYHSGSIYKNVTFRLFKVDYQELELDYSALIEAPQPKHPSEAWSDYHYAHDFINADLFTSEEVEQVRSYFQDDSDVTLHTKAWTDFPISGIISIGAVAVGGYTDFYMFDKAENFACPVRFWGFYNLRDCRKVAEVKEVYCYPNGQVKFAGQHGFTLSSKDWDALGSALGEAVLAGEVQTVRLELPLPRELSSVSWSEEAEEDLPF